MLLLTLIKGNRYNYPGEECRTTLTVTITRLRINRFEKGDIRISLIKLTPLYNEHRS